MSVVACCEKAGGIFAKTFLEEVCCHRCFLPACGPESKIAIEATGSSASRRAPS